METEGGLNAANLRFAQQYVEAFSAAELAINERQYGTKNCRKKATEQTRMIAAIIATPP